MNGLCAVLFRVHPSHYDTWHSAKTADATSSRCNESPTQRWTVSTTGCVGAGGRILR